MSAVGGLWVLTYHSFLGGRPARARELHGLINHVARQSGAWMATLAEVASDVRGLGLASQEFSRPVL
jgi:hypothetical protein